MEKMDIYDLINNLESISTSVEGLHIIAYWSDSQITAEDFAPMLLQIKLQLDKEKKKLKSFAEGSK